MRKTTGSRGAGELLLFEQAMEAACLPGCIELPVPPTYRSPTPPEDSSHSELAGQFAALKRELESPIFRKSAEIPSADRIR
jgi:hypothetical protein